jgi:hypothetical protein
VENDDQPSTQRGRNSVGREGLMTMDMKGDGDDANADLMMTFTKAEKGLRQAAAKKASKAHETEASEVKVSKNKQKALLRLKERKVHILALCLNRV